MRKLGLVLALAMLIAVIPAMADAGDKIIRFGAAYSSPTGDYKEIYQDELLYEELSLEADAALGPYFGFEFMATDLLGIDFTLIHTDHDVDACMYVVYDGMVEVDEHMTIATITTMPLFISAHFHVVQKSAFDWYVGPTVGYVFFGDLDFVSEFEEPSVSVDDEFGYGFVTGMDFPIGGGGWNFSTALRYVFFDASPSDLDLDEALGVDPWIVHVGASKRW
jgi:outer membrane protein W